MEFMPVSEKFVKNFTLDKLQQNFLLDGHWTGHRTVWKETKESGKKIEHGDEKALVLHYMKYHKDILNENKNFTIAEAYDVIFLEQPPMNKLDVAEDFWMAKAGSTINIKQTFLPSIK